MIKKLLFISLLATSFAFAKSKKVHPRLPLVPIDTVVKLSKEEKAKLAKGELVFQPREVDLPKRRYLKEGITVFRVNAKPEAVWKVLMKFEDYGDWAYRTASATNYKEPKNDVYYIKFKTIIVGKRYYVINDFSTRSKGYGSWYIDHSKKNECVLDTVGLWRVELVKAKPTQSEVTYIGKAILNRSCANGIFGLGGFDGEDLADQTYRAMKERAPKALIKIKTKK